LVSPYAARGGVSANGWALIGTTVAIEPTTGAWTPADKNTYDWYVAQLRRQHSCSHRKGAAWFVPMVEEPKPDNEFPIRRHQEKKKPRTIFPLPGFSFDFNVGMHTFSDLHQEIWCMTCKRRWKTGDPDFNEALKMAQNSSNKPSASEVMIHLSPDLARKLDPLHATVTFQDKL
jgi:hypothetical protein